VFFQERGFLIHQGHDVIDFSMLDSRNFSSPYSSFFVPNIDYSESIGIRKKLKHAASFVHSAMAVKNIEQLVKKVKPAIAHLHNMYHQLTPSIIPVLKANGVKVVLTLHDYKLICPSYLALSDNSICNACEGKYFWRPFLTNCQCSLSHGFLLMLEAYWHKWKKTYELVDVFLAPSHFIANLISRRIPEKKIRVLHNGIDVSDFKPSYQDNGYGLYFGRLSKEKGIETLLKAHDLIHEQFSLKIVGTGPIENELKSNFKQAEFLGYKTGEALKEIIANASFVVVPSKCYENCSMVVLEAMALCKPVIGSNIGGIPEQIEDGKTGFLFEMGNVDELAEKMKFLSENPSLRLELGKAARKKVVLEYSLKQHCDGLLEIYKDLLR